MSRLVAWRWLSSAAVVAASVAVSEVNALGATKTYAVGDLSPELRAEVTVDDQSRRGTVAIFQRSGGKLLLTTAVDELEIDETEVHAGAAAVELPYARQSIIQYTDFDFDGRRDLAILAGRGSCYGGPSYRIFLREGVSFRASEPFTRLATDFCGMFNVDPVRRRLQTFEKDGCCWHGAQEYRVAGRVPRLVSAVEVDSTAVYAKTTHRSPGKPVRIEHALQADLVEPVLTFALAGNQGQRLVLFAEGSRLDCAIVQGDAWKVQLSYRLDNPESLASAAPSFSLDTNAAELAYATKGYQLIVHDRPDRLGVSVVRHGRTTFLAGLPETREGALDQLPTGNFDNLTAAVP